MKRELKGYAVSFPSDSDPNIARPIPMKRELKGNYKADSGDVIELNCKAHPDEKGTESIIAPPPLRCRPPLQGPSR